jgi:uncharacterized protein
MSRIIRILTVIVPSTVSAESVFWPKLVILTVVAAPPVDAWLLVGEVPACDSDVCLAEGAAFYPRGPVCDFGLPPPTSSDDVMSAVTHFEIYASEPGKLADFYRALFGWQLDKAPGIDYWRIRTEPSRMESFNGGLTYRPIPEPRSWVHYVNVESLDAAIEQVKRLGGEVLRAKTAVSR